MITHSTAPDAYILFFPYKDPKTTPGVEYSNASLATQTIYCRTDIMSLSTQKGKGGTGSWTATLSSRVNYKSLLQPGCWCLIYMSDEDLTRSEQPKNSAALDSGLKMLGIVRSVRAIESQDPNGSRSLRYEVAGDDFQSVLDAQVYINPELRPSGTEETSAIVDQLVYFRRPMEQALSPGQMGRFIIQTMLGAGKGDGLENSLSQGGGKAGGVYAVPPAVAERLRGKPAEQNLFVNLLQLDFNSNMLGRITHTPQLGNMFTCWSLLETFTNKILNEMYSDLIPQVVNGTWRLVPTIVFRPIPFTTKNYNPKHLDKSYPAPTLKIHERAGKGFGTDTIAQLYTSKFIGEDEIVAMNYGKSDAERFNFFFICSSFANEKGLSAWSVAPLLGTSKDKNSQAPMGDENSIARNGLRPFISSSNYILLDLDHFVATNLVVRDMWQNAVYFENGQVVLRGSREHIPVGTNIEFKDRGWIAHVEAVSHGFNVGENGTKTFRTTISFVRLQTTDGEPIDFVSGAADRKDYQQNITHSEGEDV